MQNRIPISVSLNKTLESENIRSGFRTNKRRILTISSLAVLIAICATLIAKFLVYLISFITNLSFYGIISLKYASPLYNSLGLWVIFIPVLGGIVVGFMVYYGSAAIRGHGIPEAMEQILTNQSKIKPTITYLKPISSAIAIGTGGPFGAEGPIIATGGALGSTIGQLVKITHNERKILLAAGAAAGMSAIFGSPIAAIFLAIELLLFEFSPRSIVPVSLACITGAAGHHFLFEPGPVFLTSTIIDYPTNEALAVYSVMGIVMGFLSVITTKIVYFVEDAFEKIPIHWMWWPAIGGLAVGIIGYFSPRTLGVGYSNITDILSGHLSIQILFSICILKFVSWAIALGSGTSGGTLAPLLTIGGAIGALLGSFIIYIFPSSGVTVTLAALVGMSALFAGASRAFLTSIIFALETTSQANALLPLLATCGGAYIVSLFLMENTLMTEKIARRGIKTPESYEPDLLDQVTVKQAMEVDVPVLDSTWTIHETIDWIIAESDPKIRYFIVSDKEGEYKGILNTDILHSIDNPPDATIESLLHDQVKLPIRVNDSLRSAAELMAQEKVQVLPVLSGDSKNEVLGTISSQSILSIFRRGAEEHVRKVPDLSFTRGVRMLIRRSKK